MRAHNGIEIATTIDAVAPIAPAIAYDPFAATTIKINASESIETGIRPIIPVKENFIAPGVRKRVV
jgi:hypothetical protein